MDGAPSSLVVYNAHCSSLKLLSRNIRRALAPHTALSLKESAKYSLKAYLSFAKTLALSHILIVSQSNNSNPSIRISALPRGPSISLKIDSYAISSSFAQPPASYFNQPPLVVLNNFPAISSDKKHLALAASVLKNLFPKINPSNYAIKNAKRVVIFNYNASTDLIEFRQYSIHTKITGVSKSIKSIIHSNIPNLNNYSDISEFIQRNAMASESDVEDAVDSMVTLPSSKSSTKTSQQRAVKLREIGPRMNLKLVKIQKSVFAGKVLYHAFIKKSVEEIKLMQKSIDKKNAEKASRIAIQEQNKLKKSQKGTQEESQDNAQEDVQGESQDDDMDVHSDQDLHEMEFEHDLDEEEELEEEEE